MVSTYTQHINSQINRVQPAYTTKTPLGWCYHTHSVSTRKSVQCKHQTQKYHLHLDGVTIYTKNQHATQFSAISTHKTTTSIWMVLSYTKNINSQLSSVQPVHTTPPPPLGWCHHIYSLSTRNSVQCNQHAQYHPHLNGVTIHTACHFVIQHRTTSTHNNTKCNWMVSAYKQPINMQIGTLEPAHTIPPPPFGWCYHTHSTSTRNSVQCNQHTQQHHLHLDGFTVHTIYHFVTQHSATSTHNTTNSPWIMSPYTEHINSQPSTVHHAHTRTPFPFGWCNHTHSLSIRNSAQFNQHTQTHHIHLDGFIIYTSGCCHYIHKKSSRNSLQRNQHT